MTKRFKPDQPPVFIADTIERLESGDDHILTAGIQVDDWFHRIQVHGCLGAADLQVFQGYVLDALNLKKYFDEAYAIAQHFAANEIWYSIRKSSGDPTFCWPSFNQSFRYAVKHLPI